MPDNQPIMTADVAAGQLTCKHKDIFMLAC